jgi:hypothetical protein
MAQQKYQRLTRERAAAQFSIAALSRSSLWLGDDHLLLVEALGFSETYKRFFFRDIQVLTIRKTKTRLVWNLILVPILALSGLIISASSEDWGPKGTLIAASIVFVLFGIPLLLNIFFGPTCACEIRTAVQTESLPSLARVRKTQRILNRIRPMIIAAQGQLTGEQMAAQMRESVLQPAAAMDPSGDIPPMLS